MRRKSLPKRLSSEPCDRCHSKGTFSMLRTLKMAPKTPAGHHRRRCWALLGPSGALLDALGALWGRSWGALARSWDALGAIKTALEDSWTIFDRPQLDFGPSGARFWDLQGSILGFPSVDFVTKMCEIKPKTCRQRRASNVEFPQGCGGRAKRTQSAGPLAKGCQVLDE